MTQRKLGHGDQRSGLEARRRAADEIANPSYNRRRQEIVQAAATIFRQKGYDATTFADVARAVGTDRATLYYYFESKIEILRAGIGTIMDTTIAELERIVALDVSAPVKLGRVIRRLVNTLEEGYPWGALYFQDNVVRALSSQQPWMNGMLQQEREVEQLVLRLIEEGRKEGTIRDDLPADLLAKALLNVNWTYRWFNPTGKFSAAEIGEAYDAIFREGISK